MSIQTTTNTPPASRNWIHRIRGSVAAKLTLLGIVLTIIPTLIIGFYTVFTVSNTLESNAVVAKQNDTQASARDMHSFLQGKQAEILFISHSVPLRDYLEARATNDDTQIAEQQAKLEQEFLAFSSQHPAYTQLRYLDETGQEIVRVDISQQGQTPQIASQNQLQNKADRGYFQESNVLGLDEIFVSEIDLNQEQGQVEVLPDGSYRPVIRYGTPVFDENGQRRGIVIGNIFADVFLEPFKERSRVGEEELAVVIDNNGFYLAHSADTSKEWGGSADLGSGESLLNDFPQYSQNLTSGELQTITDDPEFFITGLPLTTKDGSPPVGMIITFQSKAVALESVRTFQVFFVAVFVMALVLAIVLVLVMSHRFTRQTTAFTEAFDKIGQGDVQARVEVMSRDEIGQTANYLNSMLDDKADELSQVIKERDSIQSAIIKLLDEVADVAD
ncbi:MAG: HAMP domain-containing protein, partial [Methylococcales bacterium]|nr:HAMP domain-containing protein [Methylococcales bacterium]